jgi:hypothetical protein
MKFFNMYFKSGVLGGEQYWWKLQNSIDINMFLKFN